MKRSTSGGSWSLWMLVGDLPQKRSQFPMVSWSNGLIYIFGGALDGIDNADSIISSEDGISWQTETFKLPTGRQHHSVISTEGLCQ